VFTEASLATVSVSPQLSLSKEGSTAFVVAFMQDDDGVWSDVSYSSGLNISSVTPKNIAVSRASASSGWNVLVPVNAASLTSGPYLSATLSDSCNSVVASGQGYVYSSLPSARSVSVTSSSSRLAPQGSDATQAGIGIPSSASLAVSITFIDGSTKAMTSDARTVYHVNATIGIQASVSSAGIIQILSTSSIGIVTVTVTFPSYVQAANVVGQIAIPVVNVNGTMVLTLSSYPVPHTPLTVLSRIQCTSVYQQAQLTSKVYLTDGSAFTVTSYS
jgi:hypothetical protein